MKINPVHIVFSDEDRTYILREIERKLECGYLSQGEFVSDFEQSFADYTGASHAVALSSGSAAIEIAMRVQNVTGKTVLVPANTNFATAVGALRAGAQVELVDIDPTTLSPSVVDLETAYTADVVGVIIVHMGGIISPEIIDIRNWCASREIWLFEDCAHAHGSRYAAVHAGRFGFAGGFSFFATKVITSGEGGMIITDDENIAEEVRLHRNLGKPQLWENYHVRLGTNARMSEFNALIGGAQLRHLDEFIGSRDEVAKHYTHLLADHSMVHPILPSHRSSWYKYPVLLAKHIDRTKLRAGMEKRGVHLAGEIYERPLHQQPILAERFSERRYPRAESICARHICLPIYYGMPLEEVEYVVAVLNELLEDL